MADFRNLRPWKKGQSGNPGGRPKKRLLDEILAELLAENDAEAAAEMAAALVSKAKQGDLKACQFIAERTQGRPQQKIDLEVGFNKTLSQRMQEAEERLKRWPAER